MTVGLLRFAFHEHMIFYPADHDKTPPVMASEARPSIVEVRGDGLPRFARSDGILGLWFKVCVRYLAGLGKLAITANFRSP